MSLLMVRRRGKPHGGLTPVYRAKAASAAGPTSSQTVTLDGATQANDVCVLFLQGVGNTQTGHGVSGLGATWTKVQNILDSLNGQNEVWVGVGCTAGNTAITVTYSPNSGSEAYAIVFGGVTHAISSAIADHTSTTSHPSPAQTPTGLGQVVVDFHDIYTTTGTFTFSDSPAAFVTALDVNGAGWSSVRKEISYRVAAETGVAESRTTTTSATTESVTASVLLG